MGLAAAARSEKGNRKFNYDHSLGGGDRVVEIIELRSRIYRLATSSTANNSFIKNRIASLCEERDLSYTVLKKPLLNSVLQPLSFTLFLDSLPLAVAVVGRRLRVEHHCNGGVALISEPFLAY
ncbi:unnamed protein product [Citrullus colocynthis]|uniref:Uncharacterized protein n=1 Tax=Citrullus colocynthis TaxID=252529 RepID=A0ABP0YHD8_9ROSI